MRVVVFCEGCDLWVSDIPGCGLEISFYKEEEASHFVISHDNAEELIKAIKFVTKNRKTGSEVF